jgi:uncharacterized damage-inducible protein DinB
MKKLLIALAILAASPIFAQENPLLAKLAAHWATSKQFTIAVADQMPAKDYSFKPNPAEMSFGEQMAHIATANAYFFSVLTGEKSPIGKPADYQKATVEKLLNDSFDYCAAMFPKLTDEQLHKTYETPDGKMTGIEVILFAMDHTAHHRGQTEVYLRVKNIKPTDYQF